MPDKCSNSDCSGSKQCPKNGNPNGIETEKRYLCSSRTLCKVPLSLLISQIIMSDKCGNWDCSDLRQCTKKVNTNVIETEKRYLCSSRTLCKVPFSLLISQIIMSDKCGYWDCSDLSQCTYIENDGKCKCGTGCACVNCTCGH